MGGGFEPAMAVCAGRLGAGRGGESVKPERRIVIAESGAERLESFPLEDVWARLEPPPRSRR